jgi:hypothetical protein
MCHRLYIKLCCLITDELTKIVQVDDKSFMVIQWWCQSSPIHGHDNISCPIDFSGSEKK